MEVLSHSNDFNETIKLAQDLSGYYDNSHEIIFHCYWNGNLNEKHLLSIKSCYYFNILNRTNRRIILWIENVKNKRDDYIYQEILKYVEIKNFNLKDELKDTFLENVSFNYNPIISFFSDIVRYLLLYKYGGCWFDLDIFFLRSLDPIFYNYNNKIIVYKWGTDNHPNGAIFISLKSNDEKMKHNIEFIINRNRGWGFQESNLTFDLPMKFFVLPNSWFDAGWAPNIYNLGYGTFFKYINNEYNLKDFFPGAFCFHWHNKWNNTVEIGSQFDILEKELKKLL